MIPQSVQQDTTGDKASSHISVLGVGIKGLDTFEY